MGTCLRPRVTVLASLFATGRVGRNSYTNFSRRPYRAADLKNDNSPMTPFP